MAKVTLNEALAALQGKMGNIVFKKINGKLFATHRAVSKKPRTEKQLAWQRKFRIASGFAQSVKSHPDLLAFYAPLAQARGRGMRQLILSDAFSPPKIESIDLSQYTGAGGSVIRIRATDNFGVVSVRLSLHGGDVEEYGQAVPDGELWRYTATKSMPPGQPVKIRVIASDRPGNNTDEYLSWPAEPTAAGNGQAAED